MKASFHHTVFQSVVVVSSGGTCKRFQNKNRDLRNIKLTLIFRFLHWTHPVLIFKCGRRDFTFRASSILLDNPTPFTPTRRIMRYPVAKDFV